METSPWTFSPPAASGPRVALGDRLLSVLGVVLLGYAVMGRGFAYLGVPPLFIGELVLLVGGGILLLARRTPTLVAASPMWALLVLMGWVVVRVAQGIPVYGIDAIRDGMVVGYGAYAFVVVGLLMQRPERLRDLLERYRTFVAVVLSLSWGLYLAFRLDPEVFPTWPWAGNVHVVEIKAGDLLVHLAGITAFLVLGWKRSSPLWLALLVVATGALMVTNRGGMLAYMLSMVLFWLLKPKTARFGRLAYAVVLFVVLGLTVDTSSIAINEGNRSLSVEQVWENVASIFGQGDDRVLNDTAEWRLQWWTKIIGYTFGGEYFVGGKGFGINLGTDDGFQVDEAESLRSPHNSHLTLLARGGVPAFLLWIVVQGLWGLEVLRAWSRSWRAGQTAWVAFFAFASVYWSAALINASFDVYLEGPMGGIWFWTVFGVTMAAARLQQTHPHLLDGLREEPEPRPEAVPRFMWAPASGR